MTTGRKPSSNWRETAVFGGLMTAWLGGSPFVALAAGRWVEARLSRAAQAQRACLCQVPATLLQAAPERGPGGGAAHDMLARWRTPEGQLRTGRVPASSEAMTGSTVRIWVDQAGDLAAPPMPQAQVANRTELAQGLAAAMFALGLGAIGRQARRHFDHRLRAA